MKRGAMVLGLVGLLLPAQAAAQIALTRARTAVLAESYEFDAGLAVREIREITVPLGLDLRLGRFADLTIASGWADVQFTSADTAQLADQSVNGVLDTELRLGINAIPGKLILLATGVIPTGIKTVEPSELAILGAIASDVIGFAAPTIGSGGSLGGGFAGALPIGRFAVGLGATYRYPLSYQPVLGDPRELRPGAEFRLRAGVEGPLARTTYVRLAGVYARRGKEELADSTRNGVGDRIIGYLAVNQQWGPVAATVYGFDVYRGSPQIEPTAAGAAVLPKGNLLALGGRLAIALTQQTRVTPRVEYRVSAAAPDTSVTGLERLGDSFRFGIDVRQQITRGVAAILQGGAVTGSVVQSGTEVGLNGLRGALHLEITP